MIPAFVIPALWLLTAAAVAWQRRRAIGSTTLMSVAFCLVTLHWWHWNKPIYLAGRQWLVDAGAYGDRLWVKLSIGAIVLVAIVALLPRTARWLRRWPVGLRIAGLAAAVDLLYITLRTLSVDGWMPTAIAVDPGKSVLGATLAALAGATAWFGKPVAEEDERAAFLG